MKIRPYLDKLNASKEYKQFTKQYSDSFLAAGFFVIDLESGKNVHQIDYYIPSTKKIAAFTLDGPVVMQILDAMTDKVPNKLNLDVKIDLEALPGILQDEMKNRSITDEIKKIVAVIQNLDGKTIWNLNCVLSGMGLLRAHVEDNSKTVLKMEKLSLLDFMKKLPAAAMKGKGAQPQLPKDPSEIKGELSKLNKLEEEIEKEKQQLESALEKDKKKEVKAEKVAKKSKK